MIFEKEGLYDLQRSIPFPLWVAEVYRNHGYEPDKWYGSEVAETLYNEAMATYNGPPATMRDYIEAIPSAEEFAVIQLFPGV